MLFEIKEGRLASAPQWDPLEREIEDHLISTSKIAGEIHAEFGNEEIFGEPLLVLGNQNRTKQKKRSDIVALDKQGNLVIIEIKRARGRLGVETQALQYLSNFSSIVGEEIPIKFKIEKELIAGFLGSSTPITDLNRRGRVILVARSFDETVFSMGEWLSSLGVAFRCITFTPSQIDGRQFISFSVAFDRSPYSIYRLSPVRISNEPAYYWHNIGDSTAEKWQAMKDKKKITAGFFNSPGDSGERIMNKYKKGDTIFAYASGHGAIGYGKIEQHDYKIVPFTEGDKLGTTSRHRLSVEWKSVCKKIEDAISVNELRANSINYPVSTSVSLSIEAAKSLMKLMENKWVESQSESHS